MTIPDLLLKAPFTLAQADAQGVSRKVLRSSRFVRLHRGVYASAALELTPHVQLEAARLVMPPDAVVSHLSAAGLWGFDHRAGGLPQFSTNVGTQCTSDAAALHRRQGTLHPQLRDGLPVTGPDRTFVDCATQLSLVELVQFGDHLLHTGATTREVLGAYVAARHLSGVQRARLAADQLADRAESPMESLVRMCLVLAGLPCPDPNRWIVDEHGRRVARGDLVDEVHKVVTEYDGIHHERDARQRQRDRERREDLDGLGYRLIVVTNADLSNLQAIPWRVFEAMRARGYRGAPPQFGSRWREWFRRPQPL